MSEVPLFDLKCVLRLPRPAVPSAQNPPPPPLLRHRPRNRLHPHGRQSAFYPFAFAFANARPAAAALAAPSLPLVVGPCRGVVGSAGRVTERVVPCVLACRFGLRSIATANEHFWRLTELCCCCSSCCSCCSYSYSCNCECSSPPLLLLMANWMGVIGTFMPHSRPHATASHKAVSYSVTPYANECQKHKNINEHNRLGRMLIRTINFIAVWIHLLGRGMGLAGIN